MPSSAPVKLLLSAREAAAALSISESGLWNHTKPRGACIPAVKLGHRRMYRVADLEAAIERMLQGPEGQDGHSS
ncbi:MAG: helix-turn-helix domain-containing protein [Thermoguttaceae bacterium]|jgi:predicted DNA-binding transcriptional regulator AlpA|nr:helix-turn-helix domain-containing protein [Thermoguttaceae bacterium]